MKNLPLGFALVLAGAVLVERGVSAFGGSFGSSQSSASTSPSPKGSVSGKGGDPQKNKALAHQLLARRYPQWNSSAQWQALDELWTRESGWSDTAQNPTSPAYGIPQDITGNHHGGPLGQILWGLDYIKHRYGSPAGAWAHEQSYGWY